MLDKCTIASFSLFWALENKPEMQIVRYKVDNRYGSMTGMHDVDSTEIVAESVPYIYAKGSKEGDPRDDSTRSDLVVFIRECDVRLTIQSNLLFNIDDRLFSMREQEPNKIFGLVELFLTRAD